jgi:DNA polymerase-3 subunit delta'
VLGQERAVTALARSLETGSVAHAYLIVGPPQVGKARLARDFARALNCSAEQRPCGICRPCRLIEAGNHPDVETVTMGGLCDESEHDHRKDGSKEIKICQIRRLERVVSLQPFEGSTRVIYIDPASAMNAYAADAFLKTLEEPPAEVVLLLIATGEDALPETIVSRCRRLALGPVALDLIRDALMRRGADPEQAELLARLSSGRIGWALACAADGGMLVERGQRLERLDLLGRASLSERMAFAAELATRFARDRQDVYAYLELWQGWWRDLLLIGEGCEQQVRNSDRLESLRDLAPTLPPLAAVRALRALHDCRQQLEANANARLALEVLAVHLPSPATPVR